jgi:tRNA (cmo5U34)-methyltransferase
MRDVKQHFNAEAQEFDRIITTLIPEYQQMIAALIAAIPFDRSERIRVIDLGCGTGTVAERVLNAFPNARVTCVDLAENMIAMAQAKLVRHQDVCYVVGNFSAIAGKYDIVLSSLALHHLVTDDDQRAFYGRIYKSLSLGGVFYNADVVLGSSAFLQEMYMNQWRTFMRRSVPQEEI